MAYLIKTDGTITEVKPANGKHFSLEELQGFVGGYIQVVNALVQGTYNVILLEEGSATQTELEVGPSSILVINEEGKLKSDPELNDLATLLYAYGNHDPIVGDVLLATSIGTKIG